MWDADYDVKEYHPRKRAQKEDGSVDLTKSLPFPRNAVTESAWRDNIATGGGVMMTTSEILDFAEGTDSY